MATARKVWEIPGYIVIADIHSLTLAKERGSSKGLFFVDKGMQNSAFVNNTVQETSTKRFAWNLRACQYSMKRQLTIERATTVSIVKHD